MTTHSFLSPATAARAGRITCQYTNKTTKLQIVRISNIPNYFFERALFAGQSLRMDVDSDAVLEIHSHELASAIVSDRIPCCQLRYAEPLGLDQTDQTSGPAAPFDPLSPEARTVQSI